MILGKSRADDIRPYGRNDIERADDIRPYSRNDTERRRNVTGHNQDAYR